MGLIDRMLTDPKVRARRDEFAWRQDYRDAAAERREDRRERQRELDRQQRAAAAAVTQRQRENASLVRQYEAQEKAWYSTPRTTYTGGNNTSQKPFPVFHHTERDIPLAFLQHPDSPTERVVSAPAVLMANRGDRANDKDWMRRAGKVQLLWDEVSSRYRSVLSKLRDDPWWRSLCEAAGVCQSTVTDESWQGQYALGTRKLTTVDVPTISRVTVAGDGLRITVSPRHGDSPRKWESKLPELRSAFKAAGAVAGRLSVHETRSGAVQLRFNDRDPFENLSPDAGKWDDEKFRSLLGVTSTGTESWIRWANSSGCVIGGVPGSGKTGSLLPVFRHMAGHCELLVFDGKAQRDLHPLRHIARVYDRSGDLQAPLNALRELEKLRVARGDALYESIGAPNFWNVPKQQRDKLGIKPIFLVLDEAQTWLDASSAKDKELKPIQGEISALVRTLVQKGRSAGIVVILTTQKPTSESIPTIIRDNASIRISFRVKTAEAATAVLGTLAPGEPNPADIPAGAAGRFVMEVEGHGTVLGQAGFIEPDDLEVVLKDEHPVEDQRRVAARLAGKPIPSDDGVPAPAHVDVPSEPATVAGASPVAGMTDEERKEAVRQEAIRMGLIPPDPQPNGDSPDAPHGAPPRNPLVEAPVAEQPETANEPTTPTAPKQRKPRRGFE